MASEYSVKRHELSSMFPDMGSEEFADLVSSMKKNGYIGDPIMVLNGDIIDGWHRYTAALAAGLDSIPSKEYNLDIDPLEYVISINSNRRHLTTSQRAMIAAKMITSSNGGAQKADSISAADAAKKMNVSPRTVSNAKKVMKEAEEAVSSVESGEKTLAEILAEMKSMGIVKREPRKKPVPKPKYDPMPEQPLYLRNSDEMDPEDIEGQESFYENMSKEELFILIVPKQVNLERLRQHSYDMKRYAKTLQEQIDSKPDNRNKKEFDALIEERWKLEQENAKLLEANDHYAKMQSEQNILGDAIKKAGSGKALAGEVEGLTAPLLSQYAKVISLLPTIEKYLTNGEA